MKKCAFNFYYLYTIIPRNFTESILKEEKAMAAYRRATAAF